MTDFELNKALALAIGYKPEHARQLTSSEVIYVFHDTNWLIFQFTDWNVIGPIAEKYNAFPDRCGHGWAAAVGNSLLTWAEADTAQKAIAMAVIGGVI